MLSQPLRYGNWDTKLTYMLQTLEEEDDDGLPDVYPVTKAMQCESQKNAGNEKNNEDDVLGVSGTVFASLPFPKAR